MVILYYISRSGHAICYGPFKNTAEAYGYGLKEDERIGCAPTKWEVTSLIQPKE